MNRIKSVVIIMHNTENIWLSYHGKLLNFIISKVDDKTIAEDILQNVFLKIYTKIKTLKEEQQLESWLYQITRNTIIDYYRTNKSEKALPEWLAQPQESNQEKIRKELSSCLIPMVMQLPPQYRTAILMSVLENKTQKEIAKKENISLSGAKSRVQRGRKLLKEMLYTCCQFEINNNNHLIDYTKKQQDCDFC